MFLEERVSCMNDYVIETKNLTKIFKKEKAVDSVNLNVERGQIYGLVGENGSGKSTLLKMILGIVIPSEGEIKIYGETEKSKVNESRKTIGSVIESPTLYSYLNAKKNLEYYRIQRGITDEGIVDEVLDLVGLSDVGNKKYKSFSLGMKQRLGIALAIMLSPEILILDEPINGLDPAAIMELRKILLRLNKEKDRTIIISSHILDELGQVATTYGFMNKGKLIKEISAEDLEQECKKYLKIKVENVESASIVLEEDLETLNYSVKNNGDIYLYDYIDRSNYVIKKLLEKDVELISIVEEGIKLEDYYSELIGGNGNA